MNTSFLKLSLITSWAAFVVTGVALIWAVSIAEPVSRPEFAAVFGGFLLGATMVGFGILPFIRLATRRRNRP